MDYDTIAVSKFLRLALKLPLYEGAVRRSLEAAAQAEEPAVQQQPEMVPQYGPLQQEPQTMTMNQFMASRNTEMPSDLAALGDIMEYGTG